MLAEERERWTPVLARLSCSSSGASVLSITAADNGLGFGAGLTMELERALSGLPTGDSLTGQWLERAEQALAMYMAVHGPRREAGAFESGAQTEEGLAATGELDLGLLLFTFDHLRDWIDCWR